jgi:hypothetical protein
MDVDVLAAMTPEVGGFWGCRSATGEIGLLSMPVIIQGEYGWRNVQPGEILEESNTKLRKGA